MKKIFMIIMFSYSAHIFTGSDRITIFEDAEIVTQEYNPLELPANNQFTAQQIIDDFWRHVDEDNPAICWCSFGIALWLALKINGEI